jgi:hypothetical protein
MADTRPSRFPDAPAQVRALPVDPRGFPIPAFVGWLDGKRDFRVIHTDTVARHAARRLCWICARPLGRLSAFVIGPMCGVNRVSSEPPSHLDCARFAVRACPFLTEPAARRDERNLPLDADVTPGIALKRNPGVTLVWVCRRWQMHPDGLFSLGEPSGVEWYARGRRATRAEVQASVDTGLPQLRELAELDGPVAVAELEAMHALCVGLYPAP